MFILRCQKVDANMEWRWAGESNSELPGIRNGRKFAVMAAAFPHPQPPGPEGTAARGRPAIKEEGRSRVWREGTPVSPGLGHRVAGGSSHRGVVGDGAWSSRRAFTGSRHSKVRSASRLFSCSNCRTPRDRLLQLLCRDRCIGAQGRLDLLVRSSRLAPILCDASATRSSAIATKAAFSPVSASPRAPDQPRHSRHGTCQ